MNFKVLTILTVFGLQSLAQVLPDKTLDTEDGYRIERFDTATENYYAASINCKERGIRYIEEGWVVRIKDEGAQKQVESITRDSSMDFFIGLERNDADGWYWNDGTPLISENWAKDEGSDANENCAYLSGKDGTWFDVPCNTRNPFICQSHLIFINAAESERIQLEGLSVKLSAIVATQEDPVIANLYKLPDVETSLKNVTATMDDVGVELTYPIDNLNSSMDAGEYMFVVTTQTPKSYNRTSMTTVSVHVPANIIEIEPRSICYPITTGPDQVYCSAEGIPTPDVKWISSVDRGEVFINKTTDGVYQTIEKSIAILHVEYATLGDNGLYTCQATNVVTSSDIVAIDTDSITLTVLGPPSITGYSANKCEETGSITVTWRPHENAKDVDHSVNVTDIYSSDKLIYTEIISPKGQETISTFISTGLAADTIYTVTITVCPDLCVKYLNDSTSVTTGGGVANPVGNSKAELKNIDCVIAWEWTKVYPNEEVLFVIRENVDFVYQNTDKGTEVVILGTSTCNNGVLQCSGPSYQTRRSTKANTRYTYTITTRTCSGDSEEMVVAGECVTEYTEPNVVLPAEWLGSEGEFPQILVPPTDETNGPISCIFVVLVKGDNATLTTNFDENALVDFSYAATSSELENNVEYLAVAIQRSTFNDSGLIIGLGDGKNTSCSPGNIGNSKMVKYIAMNRKLEKEVVYTYYTLTSTPYRTKAGVAFRRSNSTEFTISNGNDADDTPVGAIVGGVIGSLLFINWGL